ncbi:uncharacterized protein LOC142349426 isoform X2 [Convolutriloba macropyga]|uniref:uncharacterized protein LOC142349426 isoform X2 n=1 Tax=Convolutriloba macropyga TaxID=536237 RepID=UPI003F51C0B3
MRRFGPASVFVGLLLCSVSSIPIESVYNEFETFDYKSLLNFNFKYSEEVKPFVSFACSTLDYLSVMIVNPKVDLRDKIDSLTESICGSLPESERLDMSFMERCFEDKSCMITYKQEFMLGLTPANDFFYYFNISQAPTKQLVAKCLAEGDECDRRNDALELMKQWETIIANCQSETEQQEKELVEAIYNIDYNSYSVGESYNSLYSPEIMNVTMYSTVDIASSSFSSPLDMAQSRCLKKTMSTKVKRALTRSLNVTSVCAKDMQPSLMEYLDSEEGGDAPIDVAMDLSRKLLNCDNKTVADMMERILTQKGDNFKTGYAIWETIKMMSEENALLRNKRDVSREIDSVIDTIASNSQLAAKWDPNPYVWRYSWEAEPDYLGNGVVYWASIMLDLDDSNQPITVRLGEVYGYPPYENELSLALETEIVQKVMEIISVEPETPEDILNMLLQFLTEDFILSPFKLSAVLRHNNFDYDNEEIMNMGMTLYSKFMQVMETVESFPDKVQIALDNIGDTEATFSFDYSFPTETSVEMTAKALSPDGSAFFEASAQMEVTENDIGEPGFKATATAELFGGEDKYEFVGYYQPMTTQTDAEKKCEMSMELTDSNSGEKLLSWSSCSRPVYLMDPSELLEPISSVYQVLEVPEMLKLNFTLDFGENGFLGFLASPKIMSFTAEYMGTIMSELGLKFEIQDQVSDYPSYGGSSIMMSTQTTSYLSVPVVGHTLNLEINSDIFEDMSINNDYHLKMSANSEYDFVEPKDYMGVIDLWPCSGDYDNLMTSLMMGQMSSEPSMPDKICYDIDLELPDDLGYFNQHIDYETYSGNIKYNIDAEWICGDTFYKESANFSMEYGMWSFKKTVNEPRSTEFEITNKELFSIPFSNTTRTLKVLISTKTGLFSIFNSSSDVMPEMKPAVFVYSFLDYDYVMQSLANKDASNYLLCAVGETEVYEHVLQCSGYCASSGLDAFLNLTKDYVNTTMKNEQFGVLKAYVDMDFVEMQMMNKNWTQFANVTVYHDYFDILSMEAFYRPMNSTNATEMCQVVDYELGYSQMHSDDQCVQDMINDPKWTRADDEMLEAISNVDVDDAYGVAMDWMEQTVPDFSMETIDSMKEKMYEMYNTMMEYAEMYLF